MITAVASTKFRTLNHRPVSLVGLHGKDDLLVLGPAWAVERLMRGEQPATKTDAIQTIHPRKVVEDELRLLDRVPGLLKAVRSLPTSELAGLTIESSQHREAFTASRTLGALFRANVVDILEYFDRNDSDAFLVEMRAEAAAVLHRVNEEFVDLGTAYPEWWATWLEDNRLDVTDVLITKSGRHVSSYLVSKRANAEYLRKPRNNDLAEYLTEA